MFWDKGYTPSQNMEALLNKENVTVEEFLEEDDILQECKSQKNIINYFTRQEVIKRLVELITTEPSEDLPVAHRFRHANMACEILNIGIPSLNVKLLSDDDTLRTLYSFLENEPPLNPLLSSFFSKTFSRLFMSICYQDWFLYQKMCLQFIEYLKAQGNFLELIFRHFSTTVIPDLLMEIMLYVRGGPLKKNLYEWLTEEKLVERLITILGDAKESDKHANISEFLCKLIKEGRTMRVTEQEDDSFEPAFEGSNPILQVIESEESISSLLNVILEPNANEDAIISGILVVLTLIEPEEFVDDRATDRARILQEREKECREQIVTTALRVISPRLKEFIAILRNPPAKPDMLINGAKILPPFGSTRLEICRLFTVLLQTGNADITNAICETDYFNTILALFKDYCWNNFLHSEVEKCMHIIFSTSSKNNNSTNNNNNNISTQTTKDGSFQNDDDQVVVDENKGSSGEGDNNDGDDDSKTKANKSPSALQTFAIVNSKIISKLIDCWMHNNEMQKAERGRRLGYMGHLMNIFKHITACISESDHIGALIESSLSETELEQWQSLTKPNDGEFTMALATQNRMLANCNAQESVDFSPHLPKEFLNDNFNTEILNDFTAALNNMYINMDEDSMTEIFETEDVHFDSFIDNFLNASETKNQSALHSISHWDTAGGGGGGQDPFNDLSLIGQEEPSDPASNWADFSLINFANFDAHFKDEYSNVMGDSLSEKKDQDDIANLLFSSSSSSSPPARTDDDVKSEFDNNANVEKTTKTLPTDPFGEDDDDEANFGSGSRNQGNGEAGGDDAWARIINDETAKNMTAISNGPTAIQDTKDIEQLSNELKNTSITESSLNSSVDTTTAKPPLLSTFNEDDDDEPQQQLNASSDNITQKNSPPSSTTTTTTTNESLCQEQNSSNNTIIINQDTKTNSSPAAAEEITPAL